jgi:hypothetical protein
MIEPFAQQSRQYFTSSAYGVWMWVEVCVITLSAAGLGFAFHPHDPLWISGEFPWPWIAAILIALRFGVVPGIASSLVLLMVWLLLGGMSAQYFPKEYFLGGVILVMLCGQFNIIWETRLLRAREANSYTNERLTQLTHQHHLLILSHQNLEQEFFSKPITLRDALIRLNRLTNDEQQGESAEHALLKLLTQYCQFESAAFYIADGEQYKKRCEIGSPPELDPADPLLQHALTHKTLSHIIIQELEDASVHLSPFLIVSPMFLDTGELLGVLAVERLPFFALTTETLQMIAVMLEYYADSRNSGDSAHKLCEIIPNMPIDFAQQLGRMLHMQGKFSIESHLVIITLPLNDTSLLAAAQLNKVRRALDVGWTLIRDEDLLVVNLMPLSTKKSVEGYLMRIESWCKDYFGEYFGSLHISPRVIGLDEKDPLAALKRIIREHTDG